MNAKFDLKKYIKGIYSTYNNKAHQLAEEPDEKWWDGVFLTIQITDIQDGKIKNWGSPQIIAEGLFTEPVYNIQQELKREIKAILDSDEAKVKLRELNNDLIQKFPPNYLKQHLTENYCVQIVIKKFENKGENVILMRPRGVPDFLLLEYYEGIEDKIEHTELISFISSLSLVSIFEEIIRRIKFKELNKRNFWEK